MRRAPRSRRAENRQAAKVARSPFFHPPGGGVFCLTQRPPELPAGQIRTLGTLEDCRWNGLSVSPDGKTVLYLKGIGQPSDLMMIENFRY